MGSEGSIGRNALKSKGDGVEGLQPPERNLLGQEWSYVRTMDETPGISQKRNREGEG